MPIGDLHRERNRFDMTTTTQKPNWTRTTPAAVGPEPAPETEEAGLLCIARYLLKKDHADGDAREKAMRTSPALRRYLSGVNLLDSEWIWDPMLRDIDPDFLDWPPYHLGLRTDAVSDEFPKPSDNPDSRRGIALAQLDEAVDALHSFVRECDWDGKRLMWRVATAMRAEIRSLVAYIDAGCPPEFGRSESYGQEDPPKGPDEDPDSMRPRRKADDERTVIPGGPLTDEFLRADIEKVSHATRGIMEKNYSSPADLLLDLVKVSRFSVALSSRQHAPYEVVARTIFLSNRLDEHEQNVALAMAMAYIRLHRNHVKKLTPAHIDEGERYAELLLVPADDLARFCDNLPMEFTRRWILRAVCQRFKVTEELAGRRLAEVGFSLVAA